VRVVRRDLWMTMRPEPPTRVVDDVRAILADVRERGDRAVLETMRRIDGVDLRAGDLRVPAAEIDTAVGRLEPEVLRGLEVAVRNVRKLAEAQLRDPEAVEQPEGHRIEIVEVPVRRAGLYVPGGKAPYPSTVVMLAETARAAGVEEIAVCAPPDHEGHAQPVILAACSLCKVREVYLMGGAQAIGAMAFGTKTVAPVDVIAGPGNAWVQEAKRQVFGVVGIDGLAGPSELVVLASSGADPALIALDLMAQAEHGADSGLWLLSNDEGLTKAVCESVERMAHERPSVTDAELQAITMPSAADALEIAEQIAPEHLQLVGDEAEALADRVRSAGCLFVGAGAGTAFGDYVAGSNHVLPTGGAARFQSALSPATFRRRMARVTLPAEAAAALAPAGAALARAEGFPVHAESMERRA
jgi:histidinol dehydrogenase